jgi:hypothetical protein
VIPFASSPLPYVPQSFRDGKVRGVGHPRLMVWLQQLLAGEPLHHDPDMVIYNQQPNLVCAVRPPAGLEVSWSPLVLKRFGWRGKQHYLLSPLKRSKALKSYRTAYHLLAHGLLTPLPLGACEIRRRGFIKANVYATEAIANYITLREYCATLPDGPEGLEEVMRLAATYVRRMHDSGLWHRDLFLTNFLLTGTPGNRQLYLVDLNRARRVWYMTTWLRVLDLARMEWLARQPRFLALYGAGRFAPHRLLRAVHLYKRWRAWRNCILDVINPLRRRLGLK